MSEEKKKRRRKGQGSIYKKGDTYVGRISVSGYDPYTCVGRTQKEVERKLEEFKLRTLRREVIPKRIFVSEYIERWLINVKKPSLKASSYDRLEGTYHNHVEKSAVGRCQLGNVTAMDIQKLINEKSMYLSYSALKKIYELLNGCFQYAVVSRDMDYNPMLAVHMPRQENLKKQRKQVQIYTDEELKKIEDAAAITYASGRVRYKHAYFFVLLANTGLRAGEAIALTWENVDMENRLIYVRQNAAYIKNREESVDRKYSVIITSVKTQNGNRVIPCNDKAVEALRWLWEYQQKYHIRSPYVDCTDEGEILKQHTLPKILKSILKAVDVPYKGIHSFRHTFATNLINAGVDIKVVSQLLGHASVKITYDTYVHAGIESAVAAVNCLNRESDSPAEQSV